MRGGQQTEVGSTCRHTFGELPAARSACHSHKLAIVPTRIQSQALCTIPTMRQRTPRRKTKRLSLGAALFGFCPADDHSEAPQQVPEAWLALLLEQEGDDELLSGIFRCCRGGRDFALQHAPVLRLHIDLSAASTAIPESYSVGHLGTEPRVTLTGDTQIAGVYFTVDSTPSCSAALLEHLRWLKPARNSITKLVLGCDEEQVPTQQAATVMLKALGKHQTRSALRIQNAAGIYTHLALSIHGHCAEWLWVHAGDLQVLRVHLSHVHRTAASAFPKVTILILDGVPAVLPRPRSLSHIHTLCLWGMSHASEVEVQATLRSVAPHLSKLTTLAIYGRNGDSSAAEAARLPAGLALSTKSNTLTLFQTDVELTPALLDGLLDHAPALRHLTVRSLFLPLQSDGSESGDEGGVGQNEGEQGAGGLGGGAGGDYSGKVWGVEVLRLSDAREPVLAESLVRLPRRASGRSLFQSRGDVVLEVLDEKVPIHTWTHTHTHSHTYTHRDPRTHTRIHS